MNYTYFFIWPYFSVGMIGSVSDVNFCVKFCGLAPFCDIV